MPLWRLNPIDPSDPNWEASTFNAEVIVRAPDSRSARLLAARAFGIATEHRLGQAVKIVPWDYGGLVSCEQAEATEAYPEEGEQGVVYPAEAVRSAHPRYAKGFGTLLHEDELEDFRASLKKHRFKEEDFELEEGNIEGPKDGTIGPITGILTVTYKPTGISRQYSTGHMSQWPYLFDTDLQRGAFSG